MTIEELAIDLRLERVDHLRNSLQTMEKRSLISNPPGRDSWFITWKGEAEVERRGLAEPV